MFAANSIPKPLGMLIFLGMLGAFCGIVVEHIDTASGTTYFARKKTKRKNKKKSRTERASVLSCASSEWELNRIHVDGNQSEVGTRLSSAMSTTLLAHSSSQMSKLNESRSNNKMNTAFSASKRIKNKLLIWTGLEPVTAWAIQHWNCCCYRISVWSVCTEVIE